jgi:hypothetical protein
MAQYSTSMNETDKIREGRRYLINQHGKEKAIELMRNFQEQYSKEHRIALAYDNTGATDDETRFLAFATLESFTKEDRQEWLNKSQERIVETALT